MTETAEVHTTTPTLRSAFRLAAAFAAAKLLLHFALTVYSSHLGYGYFRDEFYYIACGHHLAWGYVDHGPVVAVQARLGELLFGESVFGIRVLSALGGAIMVFLTGLVAWVMGGHRSAQALAMFGLICAPQFLGTDGYLSMNSYEAVFWTACVLALLLMLRGESMRLWWMVFGACAGIGLLNKPSMAFFLVAVGLGLLCTRARRLLWTRWASNGIGLMVLIALPNVIWQIQNHWPTLEFLRNGQLHHKNLTLDPLHFFLAQFATMQPLNALLWITGVVSLLRASSIKNGRWLGMAFLFFYVLMEVLRAKDYYLQGIYPSMFAAGGIAWERRYALTHWVMEERLIAFPVFEGLLLVTSVILLPMSAPVLSPATWVRYTAALHLHGDKMEAAATGPLPQFYADRFGWEHEYDVVLQTYSSLTPDEQRRVCIFAGNYGEAGAIDFYNALQHAGLPPATSGQNSYWMWGTHGCDPNVVIAVINDTPQEVAQKYASVQVVGVMGDPYSMPFEHHNIYLLRGRKPTAPLDWGDERFYI